MEKKNIILIGMPGSGKTTIGTELAEVIGYGYIDSDSVIVAREGKRLNEIIASVGRETFLDIEAKVNSELCANRCVIATGGSVIYRDFAMQKLKEKGVIVYLKLSCDTIASRLGDLKARGVALKDGFTLRDLYNERAPLYEKYADIVVELDGKTIEQSVQAVQEAVQK
ncbi:MAG: shikimate kinase [Clostridia bacterium]|nr:shikimate kinase [Clostridia bacterium]